MPGNIIVLTTGGTIAHRSDAQGVAVLGFDPASLAVDDPLSDIRLEFRPVFSKGSMDIVPDDWIAIAKAVGAAAADAPTGIVVLHGTDTMHYTAAALSFMVQGLGIPVVLTGSMIPGGDPGSDAAANMSDAIRVAAQADLAGVLVVFSDDARRSRGAIIHGCRARKTHSWAINAITSVNAAPIGKVERGDVVIDAAAAGTCARRGVRALRLTTTLDTNAALVKLTPATTPEMLARCLEGLSGVVLEGTGVGHIRTDLQPVVSRFAKPAVVTSQALHGGERLGSYDVDRKILAIANVIPAGDMSSDTALVKLMWSLGQGGDVATLMRTSIVGETSGQRGSGA